MADIKSIAESIVDLTVQEAAELTKLLKEKYKIDPSVKFSVNFNAPDEPGMSFGGAIQCLKQGLKVARRGWNGKGMYLWLMPKANVKAEWCKDTHLKTIAEQNGGEIEALGAIRMLTADNKILTGWLASQTDILSEDWVVIETVNPECIKGGD